MQTQKYAVNQHLIETILSTFSNSHSEPLSSFESRIRVRNVSY